MRSDYHSAVGDGSPSWAGAEGDDRLDGGDGMDSVDGGSGIDNCVNGVPDEGAWARVLIPGPSIESF